MRRPDFMPELKEMRPFRYWCQKVLPLVYDDSLGYYELLNKVIDYINNMTKDVASLGESYQKLEEYVNSHLDTTYIKALVDDELDKMVEDGTFDEIVQTALDNKFNAYAETINGIIEEQNATIEEQNEAIEEQTNTLNTRLSAQDNRITSQNGVIMSQKTRLDNLTTNVINLTTTTNGHTEDISDLNSDVSSLNTTVSGHTSSISAMQTSINNINNAINASTFTVPYLKASDIGATNSFTKENLGKWMKYVVANYGSQIGNRGIMGVVNLGVASFVTGYIYDYTDLVDGLPRYSILSCYAYSGNYMYTFGTDNGALFLRKVAMTTET